MLSADHYNGSHGSTSSNSWVHVHFDSLASQAIGKEKKEKEKEKDNAMVVITCAQSLQFLRPFPFVPSYFVVSPHCCSISHPNSHTFSAASAAPNFSKLISSKGSVGVTRKAVIVARASISQYSPNIAEALADVSIFTASGESVAFKDLWDQNEGMAVVALLRHFGCICCWELASALKESKARFDSAGVKLIAVGVGTPDKAHPDRKAYNVLDLYYGLGRTFFNPASAKVFSRFDALQKAAKNYTIEATPDDISSVLQQL